VPRQNWSGARDLNPGPHGPESHRILSRPVAFKRFLFKASTVRDTRVQIWAIFSADY
jgi:hypothetical protein